MDILHLIDRLEELFNESKAFLWFKKVMVDEERMLDLIDQMRLSIPDEIKKAQQINNQKDRIVAQAHEEARRTLELSQTQSEKLIENDQIVKKAEIIADNIKHKALDETKIIKKEADDYAIQSLEHLETELIRILTQVRNGVNALKQESQNNFPPKNIASIDETSRSDIAENNK
jgi:hypothetical protein